jgi:hypothetical protein
MRHARTFIALVLFGIAFGYVEAAVVVYLRAIDEPVRQSLYRGGPRDPVFPLLTLDQLQAAGHVYVAKTELGRELATLVMLAAVGWFTGTTRRERMAGFVIAFGVWDIFYYVFLKLLLDWPASPWTWDILFLLPVPWVAPVLAPMIVALTMIVAGALTLWRESIGRPISCDRWNIAMVGLGGLVVLAAFCWDFRNVAVGGWPSPFNWPLFILGEAIAIAGMWQVKR